MSDNTVITAEIRSILAEHGRLAVDISTLGATDDLYAAGLTSHASVTIMLACEDAFDTEFTQQMLKKSTFGSIAAIEAALTELGASSVVA